MTELPRSFEEALRVSAEVDDDLEVEKAVVEESAAAGVELAELTDATQIVVETGAVEPPADDEQE